MAQLVSASALGAEGPPFESEYPDNKAGSSVGFIFFLKIDCLIIQNEKEDDLYKSSSFWR